MDLEELQLKDNITILEYGKSARGKTYDACRVALELSGDGYDVLYADTESQGSTTLYQLVTSGDYDESHLENIDYHEVGGYSDLMELLEPSNTEDYCLVVIDTLDHKHSYVLKAVTDAKRESDAEWQEYARIYSEEKEVMERIGNANTNILCTLDPESGSSDKPKGAQTNIHGYFTVVIRKIKTGDGWASEIENFVGDTSLIGSQATNVYRKITEEVDKRCK